MSYDDDFYTDEPLFPSDDDKGLGEDDASHWEYVKPTGENGRMSWLDSYKLDDEDSAPEDIRRLLEMIRHNYWSITNNKSFYEQALFMAGYTDNAPIMPFNAYFPTYRQMSVGQMRSYFTIRKLLRQGKHPEASLSYLFVYVYETLMQVGVESPEEGYEILCDLRDSYPALNPASRPYLTAWLRDYVVWYGLSDHYAECFAVERRDDESYDTLNHYATVSDTVLFTFLDSYAGNVVTKAALYKKQPEATVSAVADVFRQIAPAIERHYGHRLGTLFYGRQYMRQHVMFDSAVFYAPEPIKEAEVQVTPQHRYTCHHGLWKRTVSEGFVYLSPAKVKPLLHYIDAMVRHRLGVKPAIKQTALYTGSYLSDELPKAVDNWLARWKADEEVRREEARRQAVAQARASVSIDLSKLGSIREDADVVRDKLIVEDGTVTSPVAADSFVAAAPPVAAENRDTLTLSGEGQITGTSKPKIHGDLAELKSNVREDSKVVQNANAGESNGLAKHIEPSTGRGRAPLAAQPKIAAGGTSVTATFLSLLLSGGDYKAYLRSVHTPAGVMVEKINERAMDVIGDIVLEDDGEKITVIEDYRDDMATLADKLTDGI